MGEENHNFITAISEEPNGEQSLKILFMSAYFAPAKGMHLNMFLNVFNGIVEELDSAVLLLKKKDIILESCNQEMFFVPIRIQEEIRSFLMKNGKRKEAFTEAVNLLTFHFSRAEIPLNYIHHALSLMTYVQKSVELIEISIGLPSLIVTALKKHNRLGEAYVFGRNSLKFLEKALGETNEEILTLRHNLTTDLDPGGQYTNAITILKTFYDNDLQYSTIEEITKSLVQYAKKSRKYIDLLPLYQILIGTRTVLDTFDGEILTAWNDYAVLLSNNGHHSEAIEILQDVLSQKGKVLVPDDEYGLVTRYSLANVFRKQGNCIRALIELKEVLHDCTKFHGEIYPDTLRVELDIVSLLLHMGEDEEGLEKLENLEKKFNDSIFAKSNVSKFADLAKSHPDILRTRESIVDTLINLKEYSRALQMSENMYEAYKNVLGEQNMQTLQVKHNIGSIFLKQGDFNKAAKILQEVYKLFLNGCYFVTHNELTKIETELELLEYLPLSLHEAAIKGDLNDVVNLTGNKVDVNKKDSDGRRPLHYAASNGHINVARYLLKMGAMYNAEDFKKETPYQLASDKQTKNLLNSVHRLFEGIKRGILINIPGVTELINVRDKNGYSLLHWAVFNSHKQVVRQLLDAGADFKCISLEGNTPLHIASSKGNKEIAEILLQAVLVANDYKTKSYDSQLVNYNTTVKGNTALHIAAKNNDLDMVKCLLFHGAIDDILNYQGRTPAELTTSQSIRDLLTFSVLR